MTTLLTTKVVAEDASILLSKNLVAANLVGRNHEATFAEKVGDYVDIKVPPYQTARDLVDDTTTQDTTITEVSSRLKLTKHPYIRHTLTSVEQSLELTDFALIVTMPAVLAIRSLIDAHVIAEGARGFAQYLSGTAGSRPSTLAHLAAGIKKLNDLDAPMELRRGIVDTTVHASLVQLSQFTSQDYGAGRPDGLAEATLGRLYGADWFMDQNVGTLDRGDYGQATNVYGTQVAVSTLNVDNGSGNVSSSKIIKEGARFTVAGDLTVYTVIADTYAVGGAFALPLDQTVAQSEADNSAITWITANLQNILFCQEAIQAAIVAPQPLATGQSSIGSYNGVNIRVTLDGNISTMSNTIVYDTLLGAKVIQRKGGIILCG
jgi:hypothetical protein